MRKSILSSLILASLLLSYVSIALSDTPVGGTCTGIWDLAGSPYLVTQDCQVPISQKLTIKPGVTVILGDNLSINVIGQLVAVGTASQHITFRSPNESTTWNRIYFDSYGIDTGSPPSEFRYCDFSNAQTALYMYVKGRISEGTTVMKIEISDCTFADSVLTAIYGGALGWARQLQGDHYTAQLDPTIENCVFNGSVEGIDFYITGSCSPDRCAPAYSNPVIRNCVFNGLTGTALKMREASRNGGEPTFVNNTVIGCNQGVFVSTPFDAKIRNNIFSGNTVAVERTGRSPGRHPRPD